MKNTHYQDLSKFAHPDLLLAQRLAYEPSGFQASNIEVEKESADYGALGFYLNRKLCKFRVGKITPKKAGLFVTLWKRLGDGPIMPYDIRDPVDFFIISVPAQNSFGQFIFSKQILAERGIVSVDGKGGKRAMRVYPPSNVTTNQQAKNTQSWQQHYYLEIPKDKPVDSDRVQQLLKVTSEI